MPSDIPPLSVWRYRLFWYLTYTHYQNVHTINGAFARLKRAVAAIEGAVFERRFRDIPIPPPTFIVAPHRTGTSILQQILCEHPDIATIRTYSDAMDFAPILGRYFMRILLRKRASRIVDGVLVTGDAPQEGVGSFARLFRDVPVFYDEWTAHEFERLMRKVLWIEGKTRFLWKTPHAVAHIPQLCAMYPHAEFIYIHRDPVTAIDSKLKFLGVWAEIARKPSRLYRRLVSRSAEAAGVTPKGYFLELANHIVNLRRPVVDVDALIDDHFDQIEGVVEALSPPPHECRAAALRYEVLVREPERTLGDLWNYLELTDESSTILTRLERRGIRLSPSVRRPRYLGDADVARIREVSERRLPRLAARMEQGAWRPLGDDSPSSIMLP